MIRNILANCGLMANKVICHFVNLCSMWFKKKEINNSKNELPLFK
jgi:hypothetical protein